MGHDNQGSSDPNWLIDEAVVYVPERNERYVFKNNRWIGGNRDNPIDIPLGKNEIRQTDRTTVRKADRQTDRQSHSQPGRQADK